MKQLIYLVFSIFFLTGIFSCSDDDETSESQIKINQENKEAGETFLKNNKLKEGIDTLSCGIQYQIMTEGTGIRPSVDDSINVTYTGRLIDGTIFASSTNEDLLLSEQIKGWQYGVRIMTTGSKYTFYIPYFLAYESESTVAYYDGNSVTILPYSVLIFDITLNSVVKN